MRCYEALIASYYQTDRVLLAINPAAMRYAGPREAIFHALIRKNYGCTHFIVGRDHAGVGDYYGTYDAQKIFDEFDPGEARDRTTHVRHAFYCKHHEGHGDQQDQPRRPRGPRVPLGHEGARDARAGERPPEEFTRPEVADILIEAMRHEADAASVSA